MRSLKSIFFVFFSLFIFIYTHADIDEANKLYNDRLYKDALEKYSQVYSSSQNPDEKYQAYYRKIQCLNNLYKYGEAFESLYNLNMPVNSKHFSIISFLKIHMYKNFLNRYSTIIKDEIKDDVESSDIYSLSKDDIKTLIKNSYRDLWTISDYLTKQQLKDYDFYFDTEGIDEGQYPTLFDVFVKNAIDYYYSYAEDNIEYEKIFSLDEEPDLSTYSIKNSILILKKACEVNNPNRIEASEKWMIDYVLYPVHKGKTINKNNINIREKAIKKLESIITGFKTMEAKSKGLYNLAQMYSSSSNYKKAHEICLDLKANYSGYYAKKADVLRRNIEMPVLSTSLDGEIININSRNLKEIFFRLYKIDVFEYKDYVIAKENRNFNGWSSLLNRVDINWAKEKILSKKPDYSWNENTGDNGEFLYINKKYDVPQIENSLYLLFTSNNKNFTPSKNMINVTFYNKTDFALLGSVNSPLEVYEKYTENLENKVYNDNMDIEVFRFYAFNKKTGKLLKKADADLFISQRSKSFHENKKVDEGIFNYKNTISLSPHSSSYMNIDPLIYDNSGNHSYFRNSIYYSNNNPWPVKIILNTDRAIYKPGDICFVKLNTIQRVKDGFKTLPKGIKISLKATDSNGKSFFTKDIFTNEFGSSNTSFDIPKGKLLGNYYINAKITYSNYSTSDSKQISVEEYKKPEFEVVIDNTDEAWKYGNEVKITGNVRYYTGLGVNAAEISYKIYEQRYIPWYYRYYSFNSSKNEIASGNIKSDESGYFILDFKIPENNNKNRFIAYTNDYIVEISARDKGGRSIDSSKSFRVSDKNAAISINTEENFFYSNEKIIIKSSLLSINGENIEGNTTLNIYKLNIEEDKDNISNSTNIEHAYSKIEKKDLVYKKDLVHLDQEVILSVSNLKPGVYRVEESYKDVKGSKILLIGSKEGFPDLYLSSLCIPKKNEYKTGDSVDILIGDKNLKGDVYIEKHSGFYFEKSYPIKDVKKYQVINVISNKKNKGGINIKWFGIGNNKVISENCFVFIPWSEKNTEVDVNIPDRLKPSNSYVAEITTTFNTPFEAFAMMYDRSLDYYRKNNVNWMDFLYFEQKSNIQTYNSNFNPYSSNIRVEKSVWDELLGLFSRAPHSYKIPWLKFYAIYHPFLDGFFGSGYAGEQIMMKKATRMNTAVMPDTMSDQAINMEMSKEKSDSVPQVELRKDFQDTAFFIPEITGSETGKAYFKFKTPDQLTSWNVKIMTLSQDLKYNILEKEVKTVKDLAIKVDIPRFFREGDKVTVSASIHNESGTDINGKVYFQIFEKGIDVTERLCKRSLKYFSLKDKRVDHIEFDLTIPEKITEYSVRATVISGNMKDAEQRNIIVLPSYFRLIQNTIASLKNNDETTLSLDIPSNNIKIEKSVLQIEPQLALNIMSSIPFLVDYPYNSVDQAANRFVPVSIMSSIFNKYPVLKEQISKIPDRYTRLKPWDKKDPLKTLAAEETPWLNESQGGHSGFNVISVLKPDYINSLKDYYLDILVKSQNADGGFPWWPGGKSNSYITLYILDSLALAIDHDVNIPSELIEKALYYIGRELLKKSETPDTYSLSSLTYASYVLSEFYKDNYKNSKQLLKFIYNYTKVIEKNYVLLTPLGKAYLAVTYKNIGNDERAKKYINSALNGGVTDKLTGFHLTPEKYSWIWYNDSIATHSFMIRALIKIMPEDNRLDDLVKWLLFNKKGNSWKSTKESAQAIYAILNYMQKEKSLESTQNFDIKWGGKKYNHSVKGTDYTEGPKRFVEYFPKDKKTLKAQISKKGNGIAYASLSSIFVTDNVKEGRGNEILSIERKIYKKYKHSDGKYRMDRIYNGDTINVGDILIIELITKSKSQLDFIHIKDPKGTGFENKELLSGWMYSPLWFYREIKDSTTNFFFDWFPEGEFMLRYETIPSKKGKFKLLPATVQSMYSPDLTAYSATIDINVE